jgi:hypothetical protein
VRKAPCRPISWANCSLLWLYSHGDAWANLPILGQPDTLSRGSVICVSDCVEVAEEFYAECHTRLESMGYGNNKPERHCHLDRK